MSKALFYPKAIEWAENKSSSPLKAVCEGYESPKTFTNTTTQTQVQADLSYTTQEGARHYTDIALKDDNETDLVTRWKLLSVMASLKRGKLHLLAPRGHKLFAQRLVDKYNINALVHSI